MFLFAGCAGPTRGPAGQEPLAAKPEPRVTIPEPKTSSKLLRSIYREPIYGGPQVYPAATTLEQINERLEAMLVPADSFFGAYSRIQLQGHGIDTLGTVNRLAFSVDYGLDGRALTAHAYFRPSGKGEERCAALVIPGSGNNQSTAILKRDPDNYHHDITFAVDRLCDMYIYVKPNEDFLAIHDMRAKLRNEYLIGHLINSGGSYSTLYLNHTLAIVKYLKDSYDKVIVLGLSQGGKAALLNALQSSPDGAVVSSGFSILEEHIFGAGLGQIIVPGLNAHYSVARTYDLIRDSSTRYLFTFGKKERGV
jgi:hypothetical protein